MTDIYQYVHQYIQNFIALFSPEITIIVSLIAFYSCRFAKKSFLCAEKSLDFDRKTYFNSQVEDLRQKIIEFQKNSVSFWTSEINENAKRDYTRLEEFGRELKEIKLKFSSLKENRECTFSDANVEQCIVFLRKAVLNDNEIADRPLSHDCSKIGTINESISSMLNLCIKKEIK
jgi:hypothetical protein